MRRSIDPVSPTLLARAEAVVSRAILDARYRAAALDAMESAVRAPSADGRALASVADGVVDGVIVCGIFGGTKGAGRLHFVAVDADARRSGVASSLVDAAIEVVRRDGARFVLAELPDDATSLPGAREFLEATGFIEESRIADYFRDDVALLFLRRELARS